MILSIRIVIIVVTVLAAATITQVQAEEKTAFRLGNLPEYVTLSGTKRVSTSYTQLGGLAKGQTTEGVNIDQSLNLLLEGRLEDRAAAHLRYDDSKERALEMRLDYHQGPLDASFGDIELYLSETEFTRINKSLFGLSATSELGPIKTTFFGARTKGISRTRIFRGTAVQERISFYASDYQKRTYYQLSPYPIISDSEKVVFSDQQGGEQVQAKGVDYELDYTKGILSLIEPLGTNITLKISYQHTQGAVEGLVFADPSGSVNHEIKGKYYLLGQRNLIEGSDSVRVDGEAQTRGVDYALDYQAGVLAFTVPFDPVAWEQPLIEVTCQYRIKEYYLDSPVVFGSERVRVDGRRLSRGVDYALNYQTGLLTFFDRVESIFEDSIIKVDYQFEEKGDYGQDVAGVRGKYQVFDGFGLAANYLYQADRRTGGYPSLSFSPGSLQVFGLDTNLTLGKHFSLEGELAGSSEGFKYDSLVLIDDFEGEEVIYDRKTGLGRWRSLETELELRLANRNQQPDKVQHPGETDNFQVLALTYLRGESRIEQTFDLAVDLSPYSSLSIWVYGDGTGSDLKLDLASGSQHLFYFRKTIDWSGWRKAEFSLGSPAAATGNPDLSRINRIRITLKGNQTKGWSTIRLDDLSVSGRKPGEGTAKRAAAKWESEKVSLVAAFRDLAPGFYPFESYYEVEEDVNDLRIYQVEANLDPLNYLWVKGKYKNRLRRKSMPLEKRIQAYLYSTSLGLGKKDGSRLELGFGQEKEHDLKDTHSLDHLKTDCLASFHILTESTFLIGTLDLFGRHKITDYKDQAHTSHNRSNQSYLRVQIAPREGVQIIPSYRSKRVDDRLTHQKVSRSESLDIDLNLAPSNKWIGFVRYTTADQDSFGIGRKDITKSGLINTRFSPFNSLCMETNYEASYSKARESGSEGITKNRRGDLKFYLTPFSFMSTILGTSLTKSEAGKSEGCLADINFALLKIIKPLNAVTLSSNLKTRYDRKKSYWGEKSSVTETYIGVWQTDYKRGISTGFNYTQAIRDGTPQTKTPYFRLSFSPRKYLTLRGDMQLDINQVSETENRAYSSGIDYQIRAGMQLSFLHNWLDANGASMTKGITTRLVWDITDSINCDLRYNWKDFDETDRDKADYFSHQVNMDVVCSF